MLIILGFMVWFYTAYLNNNGYSVDDEVMVLPTLFASGCLSFAWGLSLLLA